MVFGQDFAPWNPETKDTTGFLPVELHIKIRENPNTLNFIRRFKEPSLRWLFFIRLHRKPHFYLWTENENAKRIIRQRLSGGCFIINIFKIIDFY
ncbi:MAG TPA: hypothetical protein DCP53_06850 [Elusimicrobia bacterium]|nr:hypothetical protein [Elusimicrobiota bacterium]